MEVSIIERVRLKSWNPLLLSDIAGDRPEPDYEVEAELYRPERVDGRAPGVIVSEGLGGLHDSRERGYGRKLSAEGHVVLVIDSFKSRGVGKNGDLVRAYTVTELMMLADAFAGLAYLASRPDVDAGRIGIIGFSYGGMVSVLTSYSQLADLFLPQGPRFSTHLSYYGCSIPRLANPTTTGAPVKILLGGLDRNVSIPRTNQIVADLRNGGSDVEMKIFDEVYHQWDGEDETRRHVNFNLRRLHMALSEDHRIRDERTGVTMASRASRMAVIAMWTSPFGYTILRDEETARRTDDILLEALRAM